MIDKILAFQAKETEKLKLLESLENGKIKREVDAATKELESAKSAVLFLDNEAKSLVASVDAIRKNLGELLTRAEQMTATDFSKQSEDEINSAIAYMGGMSGKISGYEQQLEQTNKKIENKNKQFEEEKQKIIRVQKLISAYTPQYEKSVAELDPKIKQIEKELGVLAKSVDAKLLESYKKARAQMKSKKTAPVVIQVIGNQCGGCMIEMPLSRIHYITQNGYGICEECGKIIFKG